MADDSQNNPMLRLPKKSGTAAAPVVPKPQQPLRADKPQSSAPAPALPSFLKPKEKSAPAAKEKKESGGSKIGPAFWTIASVISLTVNVVVVVILLAVLSLLQKQNINIISLLPDLLGGLYSNFEKMDDSSIVTNIPVDAQIPLSISVPVQTTTEITLAQDAVISGARVRINTNTLDIDAPANVTLPAGTRLTVALNFDLQVQDIIPIHVDVPVNIPLAQTDLHEPFVGLQEVVKPLYCLVKTDAQNGKGEAICK